MGSRLPQVRQLQQRRPQAAGEVPRDEQGPDEGGPADLLLAVRMGRHAPGAVGRGLRQQLEDHQRHRRHLGKHDRNGGPERGVGGVRAPRRLERSGHAGGGQRGDDEQRVRRALQPLGHLQGAAHHRLRREAHVAGDVRHPGQQGGDRRQPRSARRAGEEGEDGGEQRDLGGAAVGLPDGGGAAEPARDGRGHHHRALGRRRPPRRHGRRGQGPVAAQDAGRVHGQDGARRRAAVVQDVGAQAQAPHESIARRRRGRVDDRRTTLMAASEWCGSRVVLGDLRVLSTLH
ncbi:hypothetical protein PVAP13_9NG258900 [Panicum virgatum]|uniref:Uncharacterized protein n=1 Tax=Panicum virgatum TaxID=38727 RepID=A0A8T0MJ19_PANVG|nr:hypothetical protein PVAP13_9NG258900 [Panicum virgatum]